MSTRSCVSAALLLLAGALSSGPAAAVMYRCDGNLVTDSPTGGTNCVATGSRPKSRTFSAERVEATIDAEPTSAGPAAAHPGATTSPSSASTGSRVVVPAPAR